VCERDTSNSLWLVINGVSLLFAAAQTTGTRKNIDLEIRGRDHVMSRTKDGTNEETRKYDTRTSHEGLKGDQTKTCGARASAVAFCKFVF